MRDLKEIPRIDTPNKYGSDIFIQVYLRGEPFFRFGGKHPYHRGVLEAFLKEVGIEQFETITDSQKAVCPAQKGEDYELVGAGKATTYKEVNGEFVKVDGDWKLWGGSGSYHLESNQKHLDDLARGGHIPAGIKFRIMRKEEY